MSPMVSQITSLINVYSNSYSDTNQRKHQSSTLLAFVRGIHRRPVNSPHKWPVTRKMSPFDDVIVSIACTAYVKRSNISVNSENTGETYILHVLVPGDVYKADNIGCREVVLRFMITDIATILSRPGPSFTKRTSQFRVDDALRTWWRLLLHACRNEQTKEKEKQLLSIYCLGSFKTLNAGLA